MTIPLPTTIETIKEEKNKQVFLIKPCFPGYGTTMGSALRRVLLSSLDGAAVVAVKIKKALHEFSTLPYIKEDVIDIVLNIKLLRFKMISDKDEIELNLKIKGEKKVIAKDIEKSADVEILNPDLHIATLTDKKAELEIKFIIKKGKGYLLSEEQEKEKKEIGLIYVDALFSPVQNVSFEVENIRVGKRTDFDQLTLTIETDGSLSPKEALEKSATILVEHFSLFAPKTEESKVISNQ